MADTALVLSPPIAALDLRGQPAADRNPATVYLARLGVGSRRTMRQALTTIAKLAHPESDATTFPWHQLRYQHTAAIRAQLAEQYAPATANKLLAALRGVLKEARKLGLMEADDYDGAIAVDRIKASTLPRGRALQAGEMAALLRVCAADERVGGVRDGALIAVLYNAGLRRSEAVTLQLADYDGERASLTIRSGKGRKDRMVYLAGGAQAALADWIACRGTTPGPLFYRLTSHGRLTTEKLSDQAVLYILQERAKKAGVAAFSPHDLRRTCISDLLDAGADIATVQQLAGHANVQTTARYDRRGEQAKRKAASLLHVPYYSPATRKSENGAG